MLKGLLEKMKNWIKLHRKAAMGIYGILCLAFLLISIGIPHDSGYSVGLDGVAVSGLKEKTPELTDGKELTFRYEIQEYPLESISFFFTPNGYRWTEGSVVLTAENAETGQVLGSETIALSGLEGDTFYGVTLTEPAADCTLLVTAETVGVEGKGPSIWLNTMGEPLGETVADGQALEKNLVYNAIHLEQVHYVKKPFITFLMLLCAGIGVFAVLGEEKTVQPRVKKERRWKELYKKKKTLLGLGAMVLLVAVVFYYVYDVQIRISMNTTHRETVMADTGDVLEVTSEQNIFEQTYVTGEDSLVGLGVRVFVEEGAELSGSFPVAVSDAETGEELCSTVVDASTLTAGEYLGLIFHESQTDTRGNAYVIRISFPEELQDQGLYLMVTPENQYPDSTLLINGEEQNIDLSMNGHTYFNLFLKKYFFFLFVAFEIFTVIFYYLLFFRKSRIELIALITILFLGSVYNFLLTPYMVPDEATHIDMAYRHSNELLGIEQIGEGKCLKRADDAVQGFESYACLENYKLVYDGLFSGVKDASLVEADATNQTNVSILVYLPAVLGMTAARLLGFGTVPMLLFARFCSLLFFAVMVYLGMKKLPFGKVTLFLISILPMNLQQCTSFSYDSVITSVVVLYTCCCIGLAYREEKMKPLDLLVMSILGGILVYGKSGIYLPMALLAFLIPAKRFPGRRTQMVGLLALCAIPFLSYLNNNISTVTHIATVTQDTSMVDFSKATGYTLSYFLGDPWKFVTMIANTVADKSAFYIQSMVGEKLGWVEIELSAVVTILFLTLFFLSCLKAKGDRQYVTTGNKWWIGLLCAACFGMVLVGMLLTWTPMGNVSIEGVQGRYFIPLLPALGLLFRNERLTFDRPADRGLVAGGFLAQLLTVMYLMKVLTMIQ